MYVLVNMYAYVAHVLRTDQVMLTCISCIPVLRAESVHLEIEQDEYVFPEAREAEGLNLTNSSAAGITIPRALLVDRASGEDQIRIQK